MIINGPHTQWLSHTTKNCPRSITSKYEGDWRETDREFGESNNTIMPSLSIKIHRQNEPDPAFPVPRELYGGEMVLVNATVMENGMESGGVAVGFGLYDPVTRHTYFAQTSESILQVLISAINGAKEHWKENPVPNIYKK